MNMTFDYDNNGNNRYSCSDKYQGNDFSLGHHLFYVTWYPGGIFYYVDGDLVRSISKHYVVPTFEPVWCEIFEGEMYFVLKAFPRDPMSFILNLAIQIGNNNEPDESTIFPNYMEVDWVRYFQRKPCQDITISDMSQFPLSNEIYNALVGENVTINCDYLVQSGQQLKIIAKNNIKLLNGFKAKSGSSFSTKLDATMCTSKHIASMLKQEPGHNCLKDIELGNSLITTKTDIKIFPNPSNGNFTINFGDANFNNINLKITDVTGKLIYSIENIVYSRIIIDIPFISKGVYLLNLINSENSEIITHKLIIK